jgi:hypothetical protein
MLFSFILSLVVALVYQLYRFHGGIFVVFYFQDYPSSVGDDFLGDITGFIPGVLDLSADLIVLIPHFLPDN